VLILLVEESLSIHTDRLPVNCPMLVETVSTSSSTVPVLTDAGHIVDDVTVMPFTVTVCEAGFERAE